MQDVGQEGRTVLFVSHNMPAITRLCERVILLGEGMILDDGPPHQVVGTYMNAGFGTMSERRWEDPEGIPGGDVARLHAVRVKTEDDRITDVVDIRKPVGIEMEYEVLRPGYVLLPHFHVYNEEGVHLFASVDTDSAWRRRPRPTGSYASTAWVPGNLLAEGMLFVTAAMRTLDPGIPQFLERDAVAFQVIDSNDGDSARGDWVGNLRGVMRPLLSWSTKVGPEKTRPIRIPE
jgi:lipopolysaccharide transport system ATP-binding protein